MIIDTNINGVFLMTRAVVPIMLEQKWGRIINISVHERTMRGRASVPMVLPRRPWNP